MPPLVWMSRKTRVLLRSTAQCRPLLVSCVALVLTLAVVVAGRAQSANVSGIIVDMSGAPIPGARVTLEESAGDRRAPATVSDIGGRFMVPRFDAPSAALVVEKAGFQRQRVSVTATARPLRIVLELAAVTEDVRVVSPILDTNAYDAFGSVSAVVSAGQIEQLNAIDLASALRRTPGVTISRFNTVGAFGGEAGGAVFVRGMGSSRPGSELKTYIDGIPFYMGIWDHPLLDLLPVSSLERVLVHKGPQPQSFGNTFSAIDLATRRSRGEGIDGNVRVSGGGFATFTEQADLAARVGRWDFAVAQGFARSDGHRDAADGRIANGFGRVGYQWTPRWSLVGTVLVADNDASDPGIVGQPDTRTGRFATSGALVTMTLAHEYARANGSLQAYVNAGEGDWRGQPAPDGDTRSRFDLAGLRWREQVSGLGGYVSGGLDVDRIDGSVTFDRVPPAPDGRFDADAFTLVAPHIAIDRVFEVGNGWSLQPSAGLRSYMHSVFDASWAPHAGLVARGLGMLALRVRYARGVNYPGQEVAALSGLIPPLRDSWRTLQPETVQHVEAGASLTPSAAMSVDVAWFRDHLEDRYVFAFPPAVSAPTFTNLGEYTVRGFEISVQQRVATRWQVFGALTLLDASIATLPYAPDRTLVGGVTGTLGPVQVAADVQHQSEMHVLAQSRTFGTVNTERVDGFTVVNVRPSWLLPGLDGRAELFVAVENVFDEAYAYRPGYPMPGASAQVGVTFRTRTR